MVSLSLPSMRKWRKRFGLTTHGELLYSLLPVPSVLSFLLMCFLWHSFTGVACLWSVKGVGASVLGGGKSKNKPFCFTSYGFA
jgi:hypothetical protein